MKSIKELEAEIKFFNKIIKDKTYKIKGVVFTISEIRKARYKKQVELDQLKDVLGLIDERLKILHKRLLDEDKELPTIIQAIISGKIRELEELKKRLKG